MKRVLYAVKLCATLGVLLGLGACASLGNHAGSGANIRSQKQSARLQTVSKTYAHLAQQAWPRIRVKKLPLKVGMRSRALPKLRQRLILLGDLKSHQINHSLLYGAALSNAVAKFQWRHGLKSDGTIGKATLRALNISPAQRLAQLQTNMQRWAKLPAKLGDRYVMINIANYQLDLIEKGEKVLNMRVIVGKPKRATPVLYSEIRTIVLNPKWNVPKLITNKDIVPKVLNNPNYLAENNIRIYETWSANAREVSPDEVDWEKAQDEGFPYRLVQESGDANALGLVKFIFRNKHDVYLHDTPQKSLFSQMRRAYSSGCIRLEQPFRLVEYLFQNASQLQQEKLDDYLAEGKMKYVRIRNPIPIYIAYMTAWVDNSGKVHFREDIYKKDNKG